MSAVLEAPAVPAPGPRLLTIEEFERLPNDFFPEGERVELIDGLIYTRMSQNEPHITALDAVFAALQAVFGAGFFLRMRTPLKMGSSSKPEPDLYVLRGAWRDYDGRRPDPCTDVPLVVGVSDTSLALDRAKAGLYARHGLPEYWIVDLNARTVEVRRIPRGEGYAETRVYAEGETVEVGGGRVAVADVLPRAEGPHTE